MKKIIICLLLFSINSFAQEEDDSEKSLLPNINPPSPESFAITEYGKNAFNDFRGKATVSVPLYNYKAGQLEFPITVGHNGSGVKVNDLPTWTGINWTLNIGNVINRTVNDGVDENYSGVYRVYSEETALLNSTSSNCTPGATFYYDVTMLPDQYDTEVDIFNFSTGQYTGSFYLDANFNPVLINNEYELKITIDGSLYINKRFIITTPEGIKYYYGGNEVEYTRVFSGSRRGASNDPTSFYLYKIEHPINGTILIEYETLTTIQKRKISKNYTSKIGLYTGPLQVFPTFDFRYFISEVINPKCLKKIKSLNNQEEIVFNSSIGSSDNVNFNKVLNNITVKNSNTTIKTIDFNYLYGSNNVAETTPTTNTQRFFLSEIQINTILDASGTRHEVYKMEYNDALGLPHRLTNGQDIEGFYNGKDNNVTLIPPLEDTGLTFGSNTIFADRLPNFFYSSKGVLTKMYYPTGGFTEFEYESAPARKKIFTAVGGNVHINCGLDEESPLLALPANYVASEYPTKIYDEYPKIIISEELGTQTIFPHPIISEQEVTINLNINTIGNIPRTSYATIEMKIINLSNNSIPTVTKTTINNLDFEYKFLANSNYKIELRLIEPLQHNATYKAMGGFLFKLHTGYEQIDGLDVRLKRQKDYASTSELANNTRYYYKPIIGTEHSTEIVLSPKFDFILSLNGFQNNGPHEEDIPESDNSYYLLQSEDRNKYCSPQNSSKGFSIVTTSFGGDNFENGGVERYYSLKNYKDIVKIKPINDGYGSHPVYGCVQSGYMPFNTSITKAIREARLYEIEDNSVYNGTLVLERNFKKQNNQLIKIKETNFNYSFIENSIATNLVTNKIPGITNFYSQAFSCSSDCSTQDRPIGLCLLGYYSVKSIQKRLNSTTTKEYIKGIPMSDYLVYPNPYDDTPRPNDQNINDIISGIETIELPYEKIVTTQSYTYGAYKGLPTEITISTSEAGVVNKTINTYVNTASLLSSIPSTQIPLYTSLIAQNRISSPIQTQQFNNSELLSTQRTLYKNFTINSVSKILPEKIQVSKGSLSTNVLEDKAVFYNYDTHFNPVVMGYANAPKTRFIFNTDGLVVAKIENYTSADTNFPIITGNIGNTSCALQTQYPNALVTVYTYNLISKKLIKITKPNCDNSFYEYDSMWRLKTIKDHNGNILQEFDSNYKH